MPRLATALVALTALGACVPPLVEEPPALATPAPANPEAEAFARYDARLNLADARVEYDDAGCALYVATGPDGGSWREAMLTPDGQAICPA